MNKKRNTPPSDHAAIRHGLAELPRANNHAPGERVEADDVYTVDAHRAALDPERILVVGNRGMGKSFWAHALAQEETRVVAATAYHQPELKTTTVAIGFNAAEQAEIAPSPETVQEALAQDCSAENIWRAVLVRAAAQIIDSPIPERFVELVKWVQVDAERTGNLMSVADKALVDSRRKLLVVFDALDRLGGGWKTTQGLTRGLLRRALAARSHRAIRLKLFIRLDQYSDAALFDFPDASKIRNTRVDLDWPTSDLYGLLFDRLRRSPTASAAFSKLVSSLESRRDEKAIVDAIAGEFMGADKKRGRVHTWLPLHLADAFGQTSPRTFLTAWREAAHHSPPPPGRAVDHVGIAEGVRKASEDRLHELGEDYWWISRALEPLRGQLVPIERDVLEGVWREKRTAKTIMSESKARLAPVQLEDDPRRPEAALVEALRAIGVLEIRATGKVNVPDIFRIEAGIKRKGGVKPPRRGASA